MEDLSLRALRVLRIVLEEKHVTRAADRLGLSQPALSTALARIRRQVGDPLLVRGTSGMILTDRARTLLPALQQLLDDVEVALMPSATFIPASASFELSIAATDYVQAVLLPGFLARLATAAPTIRVSIRPMEAEALLLQLERGEVDLAVMPRGNAPERCLSRLLGQERFACVVRKGHPALAKGELLDLDEYTRLSHVLVSPTRHDFKGQVDRALGEIGRSRHVRVTTPSFFAAVEIVRRSDDVATMPERIAQMFKDDLVVFVPPLAISGFNLAIVWHERSHASPAHQWIRDQLRDVWDTEGPA